MNTNTWAEGLNPKYRPMSETQSKIFAIAILAEMGMGGIKTEEISKQLLVQILDKRIEVMKLPIKFTDFAKMATLAFCDRPGALTALMVDVLNKYEGQTVTCGMLADLYPVGFYDEDSFGRYVDQYLKPRKCKWAEIY